MQMYFSLFIFLFYKRKKGHERNERSIRAISVLAQRRRWRERKFLVRTALFWKPLGKHFPATLWCWRNLWWRFGRSSRRTGTSPPTPRSIGFSKRPTKPPISSPTWSSRHSLIPMPAVMVFLIVTHSLDSLALHSTCLYFCLTDCWI